MSGLEMGGMDQARRRLGMSADELWVGYFALGGVGSVGDVESWLAGTVVAPRAEHNVLAQALNDRFLERGMDHPIPYRELPE